MPGFWESLAPMVQSALSDYDGQRQEKRQRALQKLKFMTETGDVGTPVDPQSADLIKRHASEGAGMIGEDGNFTGTPEQQRLHAWRQSVQENPDMDPMQMIMQGTAQGAVSGNALSNVINANESRASREAIAREQIRSREDIANDRNQTQLELRNMINAAKGSGGSSVPDEDYEMGTRSDTQKWRANRRMFGNDPLSYVRKNLLGTPEAAQAELEGVYSDLQRSGQSVPGMPDVNSPESWEVYSRYHSMPEVMLGKRDELGMTPQEYREYMNYIQKVIATARKRNGNAQ